MLLCPHVARGAGITAQGICRNANVPSGNGSTLLHAVISNSPNDTDDDRRRYPDPVGRVAQRRYRELLVAMPDIACSFSATRTAYCLRPVSLSARNRTTLICEGIGR
jgi:hypothetical protein